DLVQTQTIYTQCDDCRATNEMADVRTAAVGSRSAYIVAPPRTGNSNRANHATKSGRPQVVEGPRSVRDLARVWRVSAAAVDAAVSVSHGAWPGVAGAEPGWVAGPDPGDSR